MGNVVVGGILILLFGSIIYYLQHSIKTKGTICTSCTSCHLANKCNIESIKKSLYELQKK